MRIINPLVSEREDIMRIFIAGLLLVSLFVVTGCTTTQKGMTLGALGGAVIGGVVGYFYSEQEEEAGQEEKTNTALSWSAIGAATGAVVGGILGYISEE